MKNRKALYAMPTAVAVLFLLISLISFLGLRFFIGTSETFTETDGGYVHIRIQHESNLMDVNIEAFEKINNSLHDNMDLYDYYELSSQPLDIPMNDMERSAETERIPSMQISQNVQQDFNFTLHSGRFLEEQDYVYSGNEPIPVLLGGAYIGEGDVADTFIFEYLFDTYAFQVVGILEPGAEIFASFGNINFDNCIIMPSFYVDNLVQITDGMKMHYANKTSGRLRVKPENYAATSAFLSTLLDQNDVGTYSWSSSSLLHDFSRNFDIDFFVVYYLVISAVVVMAFLAIMFIFKYAKRAFSNISENEKFYKHMVPLICAIILPCVLVLIAFEYFQGTVIFLSAIRGEAFISFIICEMVLLCIMFCICVQNMRILKQKSN